MARFFVGHNDRWYVTKGHAAECLLKDCEKLRTEWRTGSVVTSTRARQIDRSATTHAAARKLIDEYRREADT